jgi:DNA-binding NarL/FixJ family response regulator
LPVILLVDAHSVFRRGIKQLIDDRIESARVTEKTQLQDSDFAEPIDLILIDSGCLDSSSRELLQQARGERPDMYRAVMSTSKSRADVLDCLSSGFHGYVYKLQPDREVLAAITDLLSGRIYVPPWLSSDPEVNYELSPSAFKLTPRQREIFPLLAKGMSTKEIARELNIAEGTAKIHIAGLLRALGARNRTEAAFLAAKLVRRGKS